MTDAPSSDDDAPTSERRPSTRGVRASLGATDGSVGDADARSGRTDSPLDAVASPVAPTRTPLRPTAPRPDAADVLLAAMGAATAGADALPGHEDAGLAKVIPLRRVDPEAVVAFLVRPQTRTLVKGIVRKKVPSADVEDLVQETLRVAVSAVHRTPPDREDAFAGWLATIARRVVADFHKKRARREKHEGPLPGDARPGDVDAPRPLPEPSYDPHADEEDDAEFGGWRAFDWLERQVASHPRDRATFEIVLEHEHGEKTYQQIADERGMSLIALSSRIFEFKGKYAPRYRRWRSRMVWLLLVGGAAAVAAVVLLALWLLRPAEPPDRHGPPRPPTRTILPDLFEPDMPSRPAPSR